MRYLLFTPILIYSFITDEAINPLMSYDIKTVRDNVEILPVVRGGNKYS